ncbi:MAG: hypothetical protein ACOCXO_03995, partial [Bacteroidota bacterium]
WVMIELLLLSEKLSQAYSLLEIAKTSPLGTMSQVPVFQAFSLFGKTLKPKQITNRVNQIRVQNWKTNGF